jgi:hypothetical protein
LRRSGQGYDAQVSDDRTLPDEPPGTEVPGRGEASDAEREPPPGSAEREAADRAEVKPELRDLSSEHPRPGQPPAAH